MKCYNGDQNTFPALANALEEMGESEAAAHFRQGMHLKGCHVLDWVLGTYRPVLLCPPQKQKEPA